MEHIAVSEGIFEQGTLFLIGILIGIIVWFLYDLIRLWRRLIHHGVVWIAIEDVVFFFVCSIAGFQILYPKSLGELRVFLILAIAVGSLVYHKLVSPHLIRGGTWLVKKIRNLFGKLKKIKRKKEPKTEKKPIEK